MKGKIFLGTLNITNRFKDLQLFFLEKGYSLFVVNRSGVSSLVNQVDIDQYYSYYLRGFRPKSFQLWLQKKIGIRKRLLRLAIRECDLFIFFWETLFLDFSDLKTIKDAGKTIIICFVGSDIRHEPLYKAQLEKKNRTFFAISDVMLSNLDRKQKYYESAKKFASAVFSRPDQSQIFDEPYYRILPYVNLEDFALEVKSQKLEPLIVHAPTRSDIKGSAFFEKAISELHDEGLSFSYERIENLNQKEVRSKFLNADIVIDQLYLLGGGKVSVEAMAQGCVAMSAMGYGDFDCPYPEIPPIVDFSEHNFKKVLRGLILDLSIRQQIANLGPEFVRKNLDCRIFVDKILAIHNGEDVSPDFFPKRS